MRGRCARSKIMSQELFAAMRQSIVDGAAEHATELAQRALAAGIDPLQAVNQGFVPGVDYVGQQFARREMFLPDLVMAAEAMKAGIAVLEPEMRRQGRQREFLGRVVLGTVKGDIHEIGKTLVGILLSAAGFEVVDLGVNVSAETFAGKARELLAHIIHAGNKAVVHRLQRIDSGSQRALRQVGGVLRGAVNNALPHGLQQFFAHDFRRA